MMDEFEDSFSNDIGAQDMSVSSKKMMHNFDDDYPLRSNIIEEESPETKVNLSKKFDETGVVGGIQGKR